MLSILQNMVSNSGCPPSRRRYTVFTLVFAFLISTTSYAVLVEGARPEQIRNVFELCGIKVPPRTRPYSELAGVCAQVGVMWKDSMQREAETLPPNTIIAFDGSWSQRRNTSYCLFTVVTCQTKRIIESVVVSKKLSETSENYCEAPNMMESLGLSLVTPAFATIPILSEEKVKQWHNCIRHYAGDQSLCTHGDVSTTTWGLARDPVALASLKKFLDATQFMIECCIPQIHTKGVESFHNVKPKFASKEVCWSSSRDGRMMAVVLDWHYPEWSAELF